MLVPARRPGIRPGPPRTRRRAVQSLLLAGILTAAPAVAGLVPPALADPAAYEVTTSLLTVDARARPDGLAVTLDTMTYQTSAPDAPVVILAHGFGGSREDMAPMATRLATAGYDVVTWSARGFGRSGGTIGLNDPRYEVDDVSRMVDVAEMLPNHRSSDDGDPVVAVAGVSYGGAVALMAAAVEPRIDAVVPIATWNDLSTAFFPNAVLSSDRGSSPTGTLTSDGDHPVAGPFKQLWASRFFGSVQGGAGEEGVCARMDRVVCRLFLSASETGEPSPELLALLRRHSPRPTLSKVTAPTLVIQGVSDSLFGLDQADATVRSLTARGTPVTVRWTTAGHDSGGLDGEGTGDGDDGGNGSNGGSGDDGTGVTDAVVGWLDHVLRPELGTPAPAAFTYPAPAVQGGRARELSLPAYPSTDRTLRLQTVPLQVAGSAWIASPPGGLPASITAIPGGLGVPEDASGGSGLSSYPLAALPGQTYAVDTAPLPARLDVVGAPSVRLTVSTLADDPVLFVSLWQVTGPDAAGLPRPLVAPVRLEDIGSGTTTVDVALPPSTYAMPAGTTWRVLVSSTDSSYANVRDTRLYQVGVAEAELVLPTVTDAVPVSIPGVADRPWQDRESIGVAAAIVGVLLLIGGWAAWWRRRDHRSSGRAAGDLVSGPVTTGSAVDVPLVVTGLTKTYADGHLAVDDVSLRAERGQVVGLLGPNGAGKTTTMRMMMGLIRPAAGSIEVLGEAVRPGAPVLGRVGALVEGPGFLPHLTGWQNLQAYWAATGRPVEEAHLHEVLEVAALGDAIDKPVRSYSQGMRQRLGIAQAMLGLPELLILDEPTNGLDPPQIAAMRPILREYARGGRTVLISSHLLAEVELTCTHVVVMHAGRVITAGAVADLLASDDTTQLDLSEDADLEGLVTALGRVDGVTQIRILDDRTVVVHADLPRSEVVAAAVAAGAPIESVSAHRHLEEVFLGVIADDTTSTDRNRARSSGDATSSDGSSAEGSSGDDSSGEGRSDGGIATPAGSLVDRLRQVRPR